MQASRFFIAIGNGAFEKSIQLSRDHLDHRDAPNDQPEMSVFLHSQQEQKCGTFFLRNLEGLATRETHDGARVFQRNEQTYDASVTVE